MATHSTSDKQSASSPPPLPAGSKASSGPPRPARPAASADQIDTQSGRRGFRQRMRGLMHSFGACLVSMVVNLTIVLVLAVLTLEPPPKDASQQLVVERNIEEIPEEELTYELEETIVASEEVSPTDVSDAQIGAVGELGAGSSQVTFDQKVVAERSGPEFSVATPTLSLPSTVKLLEGVPDGALGSERTVVDNVQQAMSQITQEIVWMLDQGDVLVIWCFDMSESMKDDRQEIRDRVYNVYDELGLRGRTRSERLTTAVTSYGSGFFVNTRQPTSDLSEIREAINSVQIDPSGEELMCSAIGSSIRKHRDYAAKQKRQMALILVTDESGNPKNNNEFLELAVAEAKAAKCRVYVLGREAVFGYPHARMRWQHPQTKQHHWLIVDRGPETAFVEQLQTNGFHRRWDAFSSGFGPFAQSRMARETNGVFFMLPSVEQDLVQAQKRRYELEAMRSYRPDLRAMLVQLQERDETPIRELIWKVVSDLNPLESTEKARLLEMRMSLSLDHPTLIKQAREAQAKARAYLNYLFAAEQVLLENAALREQETSPRWQANYDLLIAQIVTYQVRIYEYGVFLEWAVRNPQTAPLTKSPNLTLTHWDITTQKKTYAEDEESKLQYPDREKVLEYIERSNSLLKQVITNHPGTPWAERAQWELRRGYGVTMRPDYDAPTIRVSNPTPVPKL